MTEITVEADGATLAASYSPAGDTAIVALHGASNGTRDFFLYERLHRVLPKIGVGVVTFDRRGEGESTGATSRGQFDVQVRDALAICGALEVPHVGLWGFSQGAWIGPLAAAQSNRIEFLALIASTGVTPAEQMRFYTAQQLRHAGYDQSVVARAGDLRLRFEAWVHGDRDDEDGLRSDLRASSREPWWDVAYLMDTLPDDDATLRDWIAEMDFDPSPAFAQVRVPTLLFYGANDDVSPVQPSIDAWRASGCNPRIHVVPNAGHDLSLADGTLAPDYESALIEWLSSLML